MKLLQLYYTSCKKGRASGNGFQVYSASAGLTEEEIKELERICLYIPPNHLPSQPTAEEIDRDFPVSFSFFRLKSGRYGVCQSVYVGKDYSERYGNYFSHALVLEEGEWPFSPIFLYGSPIFRRNLTTEELDIDRRPEPLAVLDLKEPNGVLTLTGVKQFLKVNNRYDHLKNMLNGLIHRKGNPETLILAGRAEEIPYWIAAIQLSFPEKVANQLTFSTYVYDPDREDYVISAIIDEGTRFSFQDVLRRSNMYGFDFERELFSDVEDRYRYPKMVGQNQLEIDRFNAFFQGFEKVEVSGKLDDSYDLFTFLEEPNHQLEPERLQGAIRFASEFASTRKAEQLLQRLSLEQLILSSTSLETARMISAFFIDISNKTRDPIHIGKAVQYLLETVKDLVTDGKDIAEIQEFLNEQLGKMDERTKVREEFLRKENILSLNEHLKQMNDWNKESFYLNLMINFVTEEAKQWKSLSVEQKRFILDLAKRQLEAGDLKFRKWDFLTTSPEFFAGFMMDLYVLSQSTDKVKASIFQLFIHMLDEKASDKAWVVACLQAMSQHTEGTVFIDEKYKHQLENRTHKTKALIEIEEEIENHLCPYHDDAIVSTYLDEIVQAKTDLHQEVKDIISSKKIESILHKHHSLETIFDLFQRNISFSYQEMKEYLPIYRKVIAYYKSIGKKAISLELAVTTFEVKMKEKEAPKKLEDLLIRYHSELTDSQLQSYFISCLPELIDVIYAKKKEKSPLVKKLIWERPNIVLEALRKRKKDTKLKRSAEFFVDIYEGFVQSKKDKEEHESIVQFLLENEDDAKKIHDFMKKKKSLMKMWEVLYEEVQSRRGNSIVRSLKKMFGSKR